MPIKTVECVICKEEVTKRKTLVYKDGRACREHQEVQDAVLEQKLKEEQDIMWAKADQAMRRISAVSFIRCYHTFRGVPVMLLMSRVRKDDREWVADKIEEMGGPIMSGEETINAAFMASHIAKRVKEIE